VPVSTWANAVAASRNAANTGPAKPLFNVNLVIFQMPLLVGILFKRRE